MSTTVLYVYPYIWNDVVVVVVVHVHVSGSFWNTKMHTKMNKSSRGKKITISEDIISLGYFQSASTIRSVPL